MSILDRAYWFPGDGREIGHKEGCGIMALSSEQSSASGKYAVPELWLFISAGTLLLALGVSGESLWVDEGYSAKLAMQPTLGLWASTLQSILGSESQMPGYQLYLWGWTRLFGMSEWAMRLANLPWAALFTASLAWGAEYLLHLRRVWLIICLSPFLWFYMNEARPYAMMLGLSMATTVTVLAYACDPERFRFSPWWAMICLLALWSAHMLAITLLPSLWILLYVLRPVPAKRFVRQWMLPVLVTGPLYLSLALYYVHTVLGGRGGNIERPGVSNLAFALYEFLGFGGLGPPRADLRLHPNLHTLLPYVPMLGLGALAFVLLGIVVWLRSRRPEDGRTIQALGASFVVGVLVTFALSYAVHLRLLGRHLAVLPPLLALLLLAAVRPTHDFQQRRLAAGGLLLLGIVWLGSDLKQRFHPSYRKDDYRSAVGLARAALARGEPVLWLADRETANYYGLTTTEGLEKGSVIPSEPMEAVSGVCSPVRLERSLLGGKQVLIVITDRDHFDPGGSCRQLVTALNSTRVASYPDFDAWQVRGESPTVGAIVPSLRRADPRAAPSIVKMTASSPQ
jgi:hypothetical protein